MGKKDVKFFIHKQQDCIHRNLVEVAQSCPTLYDPTNCTVHGILQARILEWVVFSFPRGSYQARSPALQAASLPAELQGKPKNTGLGRAIPSPGDLPDPGIEPGFPALQADPSPFFILGSWERWGESIKFHFRFFLHLTSLHLFHSRNWKMNTLILGTSHGD